MQKELVGVILAGGGGKRFWPLTTSKSLFKYIGKSILFHNLELLARIGFTKVVMITNPRDLDDMKKIQIPGLSLIIAIQKSPKGMGDGVLSAKEHIHNSPVFIMNGDDVVEPSLLKLCMKYIHDRKEFIVGKQMPHYFDGGHIHMRGDQVDKIVEKPGEGIAATNLIELVFNYFSDSTEFISLLEHSTSEKDDLYEQALSKYLQSHRMHVIRYDGEWYPEKYPWHVLDISNFLLRTYVADFRGKNVMIKSNVVIEGPVYIGDNVKIYEFTKIVGPVYIGNNTIIGNNNIIRDSYIGSDCITGFNTDITRSYIGNSCWFHSNYIGDSVLEENVSLGSGTVLANLRLDEKEIYSMVIEKKINTNRTKLGAIIGKNVRIGVNTSVMPGVKIGTGSFVGAGTVVSQDIPEHSLCSANGQTEKNTYAVPDGKRESFRKHV